MGCDFYTYYVVRIEYKKGDEVKVESKEIEDTRERHYFWEIGGRDEDFEELNDYYDRCELQHRRQVEEALRNLPKKEIFKDGKWLCIESSKEKYMNLCRKYGINEKDIVSIWKEGDFHYR
jgi:hypothetical protein